MLPISLADCTEKEGLILINKKVYIPHQYRTSVIRAHHDTPSAGHAGRARTHELIQREYTWPGITDDVRRYVKNCHTCTRTKATKGHGKERPLPVPEGSWENIAVDFIVALPCSERHGVQFTNIVTWTCRLTKQRHFMPLVDIDARSTTRAFLDGP